MTQRDLIALAVSFGYVVLVLAISLGLRRTRLAPPTLRSFVHVAIGIWIVPTVLLFDTSLGAMIPPLAFAVANAVGRPKSVYETLGRSGPGGWGLVFFPAAVAIVIGLWWPEARRPAVVVGVLCLGLGDSSAAMIGRRWGRHSWRRLFRLRSVASGAKTLEGSAALWLVCTGVVAVTLTAMAGWPFPRALAAGTVVAAAGVVVEAVAPGKLDNLVLPLTAAAFTSAFLGWKGAGP